MIHAYDKVFLEDARKQLATMLDYAVNDVGMILDHFYTIFLISNYSKRIENGDPFVVSGMSGIEVVKEMLGDFIDTDKISISRSREYWLGYYLSYYQWYTSFSFEEINNVISIDELLAMYPKYHEMDVMKFVDTLNEKMLSKDTNLKKKRLALDLSQSKLAKEANIPVRTIQQYEQRQKNINNAKASTLLALSKVLCCNVYDLYEKL